MISATDFRAKLTAANERIVRHLAIVAFFSFPTFGLVAGPAYAPLAFGLGAALLLLDLAASSRHFSVDFPLTISVAAFIGLCWLSVMWAENAGQARHGALQMTAVYVAAIVLMSMRQSLTRHADPIFNAIKIGIVVGTVLMSVDILSDYRLSFLHLGWSNPEKTFKYNRGLDYLVIVGWPVLAFVAPRNRLQALGLVAAIAVPVAVGLSGTARVAGSVGIAVYLLALCMPKLVSKALTWGALALPVLLPAILNIFAGFRPVIGPHIPTSGLHRLEIWDYMMHRIFEKPLLGWGILCAKLVPVSPEEIQHYVYADGFGIYPHNQWLQIWVELGALGMAVAVSFVWIVAARIARMTSTTRPYAYAAFAAALAVSFFNFEISTDSWIAALAVTALLFSLVKPDSRG